MTFRSNMICFRSSTYELTHESAHTRFRHCEKRLEGERQIGSVNEKFEGYKRRGNLPSFTGWQELFTVRSKITLQRMQSRKIASRTQQSQLSSLLIRYIRRLAMATKWCKATNVVVGCVRWLLESENFTGNNLNGALYAFTKYQNRI